MMDEIELQQLNIRRVIARKAIQVISTAEGDPRKEDALTHYNAQLAEIDRQITEITGMPPPVVIGLKTAIIFPKREVLGG